MISKDVEEYSGKLEALRQEAEKICEEKAGSLEQQYVALLNGLEEETKKRLAENHLFEAKGDVPFSILGVLVTTDSSSSFGYSLCPLIQMEIKYPKWDEDGVVSEENRPMQLVVNSNGEVFSFKILEGHYCGTLKVNNVAVGSRKGEDAKLFLPVEEKEINLIWGSLWYAHEEKIISSPEQLGRVTRGTFKNPLVSGVEIDFPSDDLTMGAVLLPQEEDFFKRINQAVIAKYMSGVGFELPTDSPYQVINIGEAIECHTSLVTKITYILFDKEQS